MRQRLLSEGAKKLEYEIRNIVKKAEQVKALGRPIFWENIGDPIQKHGKVPQWIKTIVSDLVHEDKSYGYCHSKGVLKTRQFLAERNNSTNGVQVTAEDILFFNGLGDAIAKLYQYLPPSSRIIGPSPAYSTHSSSEAAHANSAPLTYSLDPDNGWYPDLEDLHNKIKYNPNIVGVLIINPDNPTGMVYPPEYIERMVAMAKEYDLFIISDEIYGNITYNGAETVALRNVIGEVPGIALQGISKELPWPGARCGWMEFYNRTADREFDRFCAALEDAKMVEVCATTLPQLAIPHILSNKRYPDYLKEKNETIGRRSQLIASLLQKVPGITFNPTQGAFYNTIVFKKEAVERYDRARRPEDVQAAALLDEWLQEDTPFDKHFVYYLLATKGVCVVPLSSFHSELLGFRVTLLEENESILRTTFSIIKTAINEFCGVATEVE